MAKVTITSPTGHFNPSHTVSVIWQVFYCVRANRFKEAGPASAAFKFCGRGKQPLVTAGTDIDPVPFFAVQRAAIGPLGVLLAQYAIGRRRQTFFPLGIAIGDGKACLSRRILTTAQDEHGRAGTTDGQELALAQLQDMLL